MALFKIRIRDTALNDLQDAVDYYNTQQQGLGNRFFTLFEHTTQILELNPYFQVRFDNIRSLPLRKFPYSIYFDVDQQTNTINIYGIIHQAINPDKITKRF